MLLLLLGKDMNENLFVLLVLSWLMMMMWNGDYLIISGSLLSIFNILFMRNLRFCCNIMRFYVIIFSIFLVILFFFISIVFRMMYGLWLIFLRFFFDFEYLVLFVFFFGVGMSVLIELDFLFFFVFILEFKLVFFCWVFYFFVLVMVMVLNSVLKMFMFGGILVLYFFVFCYFCLSEKKLVYLKMNCIFLC